MNSSATQKNCNNHIGAEIQKLREELDSITKQIPSTSLCTDPVLKNEMSALLRDLEVATKKMDTLSSMVTEYNKESVVHN